MRLYEIANNIEREKELERTAEQERISKEKQIADNELLLAFEEAFVDYLPLIKEAGIEYYADAGRKLIVFTRNERIVEMGFYSQTSYRFWDEDRGIGIICYSFTEYNKDGICVFLAQAFPENK